MTPDQLKGAVVNDATLRPPTMMAPPVPNKKKIAIPSVFLVDDQKGVGNGNGTLVAGRRPAGGDQRYASLPPPPPRPKRPPTATTVTAMPESAPAPVNGPDLPSSAPPMKCNGFDLMMGSTGRSSSPGTRPSNNSTLLSQSPHHLSGYVSMGRLGGKSPLQSLPVASSPMASVQPQPPPRRHQSGFSGPVVGVAAGSESLHSKCVSVKVIVDLFAPQLLSFKCVNMNWGGDEMAGLVRLATSPICIAASLLASVILWIPSLLYLIHSSIHSLQPRYTNHKTP